MYVTNHNDTSRKCYSKFKSEFFESRWSVCPIYQVTSSLLENNILKQQSREKLIRSLPSDIDYDFSFSWLALIRKVTSLGRKKEQRYYILYSLANLIKKKNSSTRRAISVFRL